MYLAAAMKTRRFFVGKAARVVLAGLLATTSAAFSQSASEPGASSPPPPLLPKDAKSLLSFLGSANGLDTSGAHAWHLKLAYDHFDSDGDNDSSGVFEEFWAGPKKFRRIYTSDGFNQTQVGSEHGLFLSGSQKWPGSVETQAWEEVVEPLYRTTFRGTNTKLDKLNWPVGGLKLPCVVLRRTGVFVLDGDLPKYCFGPDSSVLRYTRGRQGWDETTYNEIVVFQGRYVGREVQVTQAGKKYLDIRVQELSAIVQMDEADFTPAAGAVHVEDRIEVDGAELSDHMVKMPSIDKRLGGSQGTFVFILLIGKDGRVKEAKVVDGPEKLREAAEATARTMEFRPFLVLGAPVEVRAPFRLEVR